MRKLITKRSIDLDITNETIRYKIVVKRLEKIFLV